jgi:hypothetical protein
MAIVTGPLYHERAHGTIGKQITWFWRKGRIITRRYSYVNLEPTEAQQDQRDLFTFAALHRRNLFNEPWHKLQWCRYQNLHQCVPTWFNAQISALMTAFVVEPHSAFMTGGDIPAQGQIRCQFTCQTCNDNAHVAEVFNLWLGPTHDQMINVGETTPDANGCITFEPQVLLPGSVYFIFTIGEHRSGMMDMGDL